MGRSCPRICGRGRAGCRLVWMADEGELPAIHATMSAWPKPVAVVAFGFVAMFIAAGCGGSDTATIEPGVEGAEVTTSPEATAVPSGVDGGFLAENIARVGVPGDGGSVMVVVVEPDDTVTFASAGMGPEGTAPTADDIFRIGSITKVFT